MAKKRKSRGNDASNDGPNMENIGNSKKRIRDYTDVADSDDEFHLNRDQVLLGEAPDAKRRRKQAEQEEFLDDAEEEVLGVESEGDEDDYDNEEGDGDDALDEDEDDEFRWGVGKDDMYGADAIETEEQALEEEAEALRLQKKQLQSMSAADYGFDEADWQGQADVEDPARAEGTVVTEVLPQLQIPEDMSSAERLKLLKSRYPEFEPLSKELLRMRETHDVLAKEVDEIDELDLIPNLTTKSRAAAAYLGSLTMYFALLCSPASGGAEGATALSADRLRDHPVMDSLVRCRELWQKAERLPDDFEYLTESEDEDEAELAAADEPAEVRDMVVQQPLEKTRAQRHAEAAEAAEAARRAERLQRTEDNLADLDTLLAQNAAKKKTKSKQSSKKENKIDSDLGEEAPLTAEEAAEKARHRKSLRFYTSQIAQKANKRGAAGRNAGGDDDVPYRERLRDRQIRLNAEAEKRGQQSSSKTHDPAADLGGDSDEEDARQARQIRAEANASDDDYYDLVAARTAKKKADRAALADAQREAAQRGGRVVEEETVGADGKRKISYAIEKNKGLTPHRKKDVRNPRVKKRKKFEDKKKKLASIKPVYKGGEGRGGYGGELTGIKSGLVKSTKL